MQEIRVKGLVVRTVNYGEKDRIVSLFTEEMGLITVMANGSRVLKSRSLLATEQFCYGKYLLQQKNERYTVKEVELLESFFDIRKDVEKMALAEYLCQVVYQTGTENQPDRDMLRLILNSLFAIASGRYPLDMVKGAFEMRAAAIFGFRPDLRTCSVGRKGSRDVLLDVENGSVICGNCRAEQSGYEPQDSETSTAACLLTAGAR
ncbi:MAG: DNA repair protein RecO, partial [Clostridia bacterium]|nr:DNA repair protein RecO [Clostridia bacterium]